MTDQQCDYHPRQNNMALHLIAQQGNIALLQKILKKAPHLNLYVKNNKNETPLNIAKKAGQKAMVEFLEITMSKASAGENFVSKQESDKKISAKSYATLPPSSETTSQIRKSNNVSFFQNTIKLENFPQSSDDLEKSILNFILTLTEIEYNKKMTKEKRNLFNLLTLPEFDYMPGNCLFAAIAKIIANDETAQTLRQKTVKYLAQDKQLKKYILAGVDEETLTTAKGEIVYTSVNSPNDLNSYLYLMGQNLTWGTQIEVVAIARLFKHPIVILTPGNRFDEIIAESAYQNNEPIFLNYINKNHYEPLIVPEKFDGKAIFAQINTAINERKNQHTEPHVAII